MSTTQQEAANDNVKVLFTRDPGCRVTFDITVPAKQAQSAYSKAIKSVNKEISVPGFRKGKAPEKLVLQNYGKYVQQEWRNIVMDTAFQEAVNLTKLYPLHQETIQSPEVKELSENGARVTLRFESHPEVPELDLSQLSVTTPQKEPVSDKQIEKAIEDLRLFHANWVDVTDRGVAEGDYVDLDIDAIESPSYNICTNERFEVNAERMPAWMRKLTLGLTVGQNAEGISERDESMPADAEFKPTKIRATLKAIKKPELPALDDELAKKAGVESVEILRERIRQSLDAEAEANVNETIRQAIITQLLEKFPLDMPGSLVQSEREGRIRNIIRALQKDHSQEQIKEKSSDIEAKATYQALVFTTLFYLLRPLLQKHHLNITQDDLYQELTRQLHHIPTQDQVIERDMTPEVIRGKLVAAVTINKGLAYLVKELRG